METSFKPLSELQIDNDFLFMLVMQNKSVCKNLAEILLGIKIGDIVYETQKTNRPFYYAKSVRLDVYIKDSNKVINIEMQSSHYKYLPMRARYYQAMIDATVLEPGQNYDELPITYILFICKDDPFDANEPIYTQKIICAENNAVDLTNGTNTKFFNCAAYDKIDKLSNANNTDLRAFMEYVATNKATNDFTKDLNDIIIKEKLKEENIMMYNDFNMLEMDAKSAGIAEGRRLGKQEGVLLGKQEGLLLGKQEGVRLGKQEGLLLGKQEGVRLGIIQQKEQDDKIIAQLRAELMAYKLQQKS